MLIVEVERGVSRRRIVAVVEADGALVERADERTEEILMAVLVAIERQLSRKEVAFGHIIHIFHIHPTVVVRHRGRFAGFGAGERCSVLEGVVFHVVAPLLEARHKLVLSHKLECRALVVDFERGINLPFLAAERHQLPHHAKSATRVWHLNDEVEHEVGLTESHRWRVVIFYAFHRGRVESADVLAAHGATVDAKLERAVAVEAKGAGHRVDFHVGQLHLLHQVGAVGCHALNLRRRGDEFAVAFVDYRRSGYGQFAKIDEAVGEKFETVDCRTIRCGNLLSLGTHY